MTLPSGRPSCALKNVNAPSRKRASPVLKPTQTLPARSSPNERARSSWSEGRFAAPVRSRKAWVSRSQRARPFPGELMVETQTRSCESSKEAKDLSPGEHAFFSEDRERARTFDLCEVVCGGKAVKLSALRYPPLAAPARLQRHALVHPTEVFPLQGVRHEPREALPVEASEARPVGSLTQIQQVNPPAVEDARALIAEDAAPETHRLRGRRR